LNVENYLRAINVVFQINWINNKDVLLQIHQWTPTATSVTSIILPQDNNHAYAMISIFLSILFLFSPPLLLSEHSGNFFPPSLKL
jgi:hypothetical protein